MPHRTGLELEIVGNAGLRVSHPDPLERPKLGDNDASGEAVLAGQTDYCGSLSFRRLHVPLGHINMTLRLLRLRSIDVANPA